METAAKPVSEAPGVAIRTAGTFGWLDSFLVRLRCGAATRVLARGTFAAMMVRVAGLAVGLVFQGVFARWLGADAYGEYAYVIAWLGVLTLVAKCGGDTATVRFAPEYYASDRLAEVAAFRRWRDRRSLFACVTFGIVGGIVLAASWTYVNANLSAAAALALAALIPVVLIELHAADLRAARWSGWSELPIFIVRPLLAVAIVASLTFAVGSAASSPVALGVYGVSSVATLTTVWLSGRWLLPSQKALAHASGYDKGLACASGYDKALAHASGYDKGLACASGYDAPAEEQLRWQQTTLPLALLALFNLALTQSDVLLLGMLCDTRTAGIYSVAVRLAGLVSFALVVMSSVLAPIWAELHATSQKVAMRRLAAVASLGLVISTLPVAGLLILIGIPILRWFGADFVEGYWPLAILCGGQLVNALAGPVCQLLTMSGRQNVAAKVLGAFAVIHILLAAILISQWSLVGAALATAIATIGWNVTLAWCVRRELGVDSTIFGLRQLFRSTTHA